MQALETSLRERGVYVLHGGEFDDWDLEARGGALGGVRVTMAIEEHGAGRQLVRLRTTPRPTFIGRISSVTLAALALGAGADGATVAAGLLGAWAALTALLPARQCAAAMAAVRASFGGNGA